MQKHFSKADAGATGNLKVPSNLVFYRSCRYGVLGVSNKALYPPLHTAEPIREMVGASGITLGKKMSESSEGKKTCEHQGQRIRSGKRCSPWRDHRGAGISLHDEVDVHIAAHRESHGGAAGYFLKKLKSMESAWRGKFILKNSSLWEGLTMEQRKSVKRKEWQRGAVVG